MRLSLNQKTIPSLPTCWILLGMAALSFIPTLFLPYIGEEGVYTITSMEMARSREWLVPTLYGVSYTRPPLVNWLMIPLTKWLGWQNILLASRIIAAVATVGTGLLLIVFVRRIYGNMHLAVLSGLFFFSGDILFNRGWLAYVDPHFSFFIFLAISSMLLAVHENRPWFLTGVLVGLTGAFMSKALTGHVFYAISLLVVFSIEKENRRILLNPVSILLHVLAFAYPLFWWSLVETSGTKHHMLWVLIAKLSGEGSQFSLWSYIGERFAYLGETFRCLLPGSALVTYLIYHTRGFPSLKEIPLARVIMWFVLLNYLPYLFSPSTNIRYILPLYPWCALLVTMFLVRSTEFRLDRWIYSLFGVLITLKFVAGIWFFSWYEMNFRSGDFEKSAQHVIAQTKEHPLYVVDGTYLGLSLTAHINLLRFPEGPLTKPDNDWADGFVLSGNYNSIEGQKVHTYIFARGELYLHCRGSACPKETQQTEGVFFGYQ